MSSKVVGADAADVFEGAGEGGVDLETAAFGHLVEREAWVTLQEVFGLFDFDLLDVGGRRAVGEGEQFPIELTAAHAHGRGKRGYADVAMVAEAEVDGVGHFAQEEAVGLGALVGEGGGGVGRGGGIQ